MSKVLFGIKLLKDLVKPKKIKKTKTNVGARKHGRELRAKGEKAMKEAAAAERRALEEVDIQESIDSDWNRLTRSK